MLAAYKAAGIMFHFFLSVGCEDMLFSQHVDRDSIVPFPYGNNLCETCVYYYVLLIILGDMVFFIL